MQAFSSRGRLAAVNSVCNIQNKNKNNPHEWELFFLAPGRVVPPPLGQWRGQPGELKNHSLDDFLPACGQAVPFDSPTSL